MKFTVVLAAVASLVASAQASPVELEERRLAAKVTLCEKPNLQDCDTTYIPINTCYYLDTCTIQSLNTGGHICDFYTEPGCGGFKHQYWGTKGSQPLNLDFQSVSCW